MDWSNPKQVAAFMDLHSGNPREGPGDKASTARALAAVTAAAGDRQIESVLDLACGPGMQTRHLAELLPTSHITALDIHPAFLAELEGWIAQNNLEQQVTTVHGDMKQPPVATGSFDLIWCEGAAYMLGVGAALQTWQPYLRADPAQGFIALSEPVFLSAQLPQPVVENWAEYAEMSDEDGIAARVADAGFELLESFILPPAAWAAYYDPLQKRVDALRTKYVNDADGRQVINEGQREIDAWRNYGEYFSYAFIVTRPR